MCRPGGKVTMGGFDFPQVTPQETVSPRAFVNKPKAVCEYVCVCVSVIIMINKSRLPPPHKAQYLFMLPARLRLRLRQHLARCLAMTGCKTKQDFTQP